MENDNNIISLTSKVKFIRYDGGKSGFKIAVIEVDGSDRTIKGIMPGLVEGATYRFELSSVFSEKYGFQFDVKNFKSEKPLQIDDLEAFLASGMFKGIGEKTAKEIIRHFGKETYDVITKDIDRLTEVKGIGKKTVAKIKAAIEEDEDNSVRLYNLVSLGFTVMQAKRILDYYGESADEKLRDNPYSLCFEVKGISIAAIDRITKKLGLDLQPEYRLEAIISHSLNRYIYSGGHHYVDKDELFNHVNSITKLSRELFDDLIVSMNDKAYIVSEHKFKGERIYSSESIYWEQSILDELIRLATTYKKPAELRGVSSDVRLSEEQLDAIEYAFDEGLFILTGPAGSGKTTVLKELLFRASLMGLEVALAAPTGRAAARMEEVVGRQASTIHRLLEFEYNEDDMNLYFKRNSNNPLKADVLFIDESSMLDSRLFMALLHAIKSGALLVLIGDTNQLPPVAPGCPLKDLIDSGVCNRKNLTGIHRQGKNSDILKNARAILDEEPFSYNRKGGDFFYIERHKSDANMNLITELVSEIIPEKFKINSDDICVLSPVKEGYLGVNSLNAELQKKLNPNAPRLYFQKFALGDKVMQMKNDYELEWANLRTLEKGMGVFNGDIGRIISISNEGLSVEFSDGRMCDYSPKDIENLDLAYALTIHKSQGNEFSVVIFPSFYYAPVMRSKNLIYTAVTRAKKLFIMTGLKSVFEETCRSSKTLERNSSLSERLRLIFEERNY